MDKFYSLKCFVNSISLFLCNCLPRLPSHFYASPLPSIIFGFCRSTFPMHWIMSLSHCVWTHAKHPGDHPALHWLGSAQSSCTVERHKIKILWHHTFCLLHMTLSVLCVWSLKRASRGLHHVTKQRCFAFNALLLHSSLFTSTLRKCSFSLGFQTQYWPDAELAVKVRVALSLAWARLCRSYKNLLLANSECV